MHENIRINYFVFNLIFSSNIQKSDIIVVIPYSIITYYTNVNSSLNKSITASSL
jgi:hypothetical protein